MGGLRQQYVARDLTLAIIALLSVSLAIRLRDCSRFVTHPASNDGQVPDTSGMPGLLFLDTRSWPRRTRWLPECLLAGAVLMTQALVFASSRQPSVLQGLPALALAVAVVALGWAIRERRVIVRAAHEAA